MAALAPNGKSDSYGLISDKHFSDVHDGLAFDLGPVLSPCTDGLKWTYVQDLEFVINQ